MKKKNNQKGFTLVELLVVIVIIGIITVMSWPVITRIQENNQISQYEKYGETLVAAAKLYIDSYEEDMFYYEDDLSPTLKSMGQCGYITYEDLKEHSLIKDFGANGISCNSDSTFVKVVRRKNRYTYTYYLGCGNKHTDGSKLSDSEVYFTLPEENHLNVIDPDSCNENITEYKLTYDSKGGSECLSQSVYTDDYSTETWGTLCTPTKPGYIFSEWRDAAGNVITADTVASSDLTVYANWKDGLFSITYDYNGGAAPGSGVPNSYTYGIGATINGKPTKAGYTFNGWSNKEDLTGATYTKVIAATATGNKKFYAKWCENCSAVANGTCTLSNTEGSCKYVTTCNSGYKISGNGTAKPVCSQTQATFESTLHSEMRSLALDSLDAIKAFKKGNEVPKDNYKTVQTYDSDLPIYIWYEYETIYWYSDAQSVYLPPYSSGLFSRMTNLTDISGLSTIKTDKTYSMSFMFEYNTNLQDLTPLTNWNTANVTDMYGMFQYCRNIRTLNGLQKWNTAKVTTVHDMFLDNRNLVDISPLANWNTSSVVDFVSMFFSAQRLTNISAVANWDLSSAKEIRCIFFRNYSLVDISPVRNWNVSNVYDMQNIFYGDYNVRDISALSNWSTKTGNVTILEGLLSYDWYEASESEITYGVVHNMSISSLQPLQNWNVSKVTTVANFCRNCSQIGSTASYLNGWRLPAGVNKSDAFNGASSRPSWY